MWARLDDGWHDDPRFRALTKGAALLWVRLLSWCCRHESDGEIPRWVAPSLEGTDAEVAELVLAGHLVQTDAGWRMAWDQPTRAERDERRAATAKRVAAWRSKDARNAVTSGVTNAVRNASPVPTRPDPEQIQTPPLTTFEGGPGGASQPPSAPASAPKAKRSAKPARAPEVEMPDGWPVADDLAALVAYGAQHGLSGDDVRHEVEGMRQWSRANGARKRDWLEIGRAHV